MLFRKLIVVFVVSVFVSSTVPGLAQTAIQDAAKANGTAHAKVQGKGKRIQQIASRLNLTADQAQQIQTIYREEMNRARAVKVDPAVSPDEKRTRLTAIRRETRQRIDAVLTAEQRTELRQIQHGALAGTSTPTAPAEPPQPAGTAPSQAPLKNP